LRWLRKLGSANSEREASHAQKPKVEERAEFEVPFGSTASVFELQKADKATHRLIHIDFPGITAVVKEVDKNPPMGVTFQVEELCRLKDVKDSETKMDLKIVITKDGKATATLKAGRSLQKSKSRRSTRTAGIGRSALLSPRLKTMTANSWLS
jgi:hypothetical protein